MVHLIGSPICDQRLNRGRVRPVRPIWLESDRFVEASTRLSESAGRALFRQRRYARKSPGQDVEAPRSQPGSALLLLEQLLSGNLLIGDIRQFKQEVDDFVFE